MTPARLLREAGLTIAAVAGVLVLLAGVAVAALHLHPLVFRSGSMAPAIDTGAVGIARSEPASELVLGDVVSVTTAEGTRVTHRVVALEPAPGGVVTLTLQGDANDSPDAQTYPVTEALVVSRSIPAVGYVVVWLSGPSGLLALGGYAMAMLVLLVRRAPAPPRDPGPGSGGGAAQQRPGRVGGSRRVVTARHVALCTAVSTLAVVVAAPAWSAWTNPATVTATLTANPWFTCNAAIRGVAAPFLYYKLDETTPVSVLGVDQTAADSSGNGRTGQYRGAVTALLPGKTSSTAKACVRDTGTSITFDGVRGYLSSPNAGAITGGAFNTFTLSVWFRAPAGTTGKLIGLGNAATGASSINDRHLYLSGGVLYFGVFPGAVRTVTSGSTAVTDNLWHQAVATLSPAGMRLYVDGALVGNDPATTTAQQDYAAAYLRIGYDNLNGWPNAPASYFYGGTLDEVAVYTSALTVDQVRQTYVAGR